MITVTFNDCSCTTSNSSLPFSHNFLKTSGISSNEIESNPTMNKILVRMILKIGFHPSSTTELLLNDFRLISQTCVWPVIPVHLLSLNPLPFNLPFPLEFYSCCSFDGVLLLHFSQLFQFHRNFSVMPFSVNCLIFITLAFNSLSLSLSLFILSLSDTFLDCFTLFAHFFRSLFFHQKYIYSYSFVPSCIFKVFAGSTIHADHGILWSVLPLQLIWISHQSLAWIFNLFLLILLTSCIVCRCIASSSILLCSLSLCLEKVEKDGNSMHQSTTNGKQHRTDPTTTKRMVMIIINISWHQLFHILFSLLIPLSLSLLFSTISSLPLVSLFFPLLKSPWMKNHSTRNDTHTRAERMHRKHTISIVKDEKCKTEKG